MTNWKELEKRFAARLALGRRPVAVTFLDAEPSGIPKFSGTEPAGCSFWRLAAAGRTFYTVPADHFNCAVGAYTHNIQLPPDRVQETETMLGMMFNLGYVRPEEVPGIPRLPKEPAAVVFAPLGDAPVAPSVVLFACKTSAAMLLNEASIRAGASSTLPLLGRPSCMALPAALAHGTVSTPRLHRESRVHQPGRGRNVCRRAGRETGSRLRRAGNHRHRKRHAGRICARAAGFAFHGLACSTQATLALSGFVDVADRNLAAQFTKPAQAEWPVLQISQSFVKLGHGLDPAEIIFERDVFVRAHARFHPAIRSPAGCTAP